MRGRGGVSGAFSATAAQLQLRLLQVYQALPTAAAFASEHEILSKLCSRLLRGNLPSANPGIQSSFRACCTSSSDRYRFWGLLYLVQRQVQQQKLTRLCKSTCVPPQAPASASGALLCNPFGGGS
jgi:hypothetical protein